MRLSQRCCVESGVIFETIGKMEESTNRVTSMKQLKVLRFHSPSDVMLLHHKFPLPQKKKLLPVSNYTERQSGTSFSFKVV